MINNADIESVIDEIAIMIAINVVFVVDIDVKAD